MKLAAVENSAAAVDQRHRCGLGLQDDRRIGGDAEVATIDAAARRQPRRPPSSDPLPVDRDVGIEADRTRHRRDDARPAWAGAPCARLAWAVPARKYGARRFNPVGEADDAVIDPGGRAGGRPG